MKRTILTFALLTSISLTSFAVTDASLQNKGRRDFKKELKLSEQQKNQMDEINENFDQKIVTVKNSRIVEEVQQERIKKLREEKREAIAQILTPEQKMKFENKTQKGKRHHTESKRKGDFSHRKNFRDHMGQGQFAMFENLNLTDVQKEQMKSLKEKFAEEHKTTHKKHTDEMMKILTPEQKKQIEENKSKFVESRKERKENIEKMKNLDANGKEKLKELKEKYNKEKGAIERSRIAPDMQKMKLEILKENFEKDKKELLNTAK